MHGDATLKAWFEALGDLCVDVELGGELFGGRRGESIQCPRSYRIDEESLVIHFNTTETLTITRPSDISTEPPERQGWPPILVIQAATDVRFGCYFYGRPQTPENWCELIYRWEVDLWHRSVTGPIRSPAFGEALGGRGYAAVRLMPDGYWRRQQ